ncbi:MAG: hypothetical protein SPL99_06380 [Catonella sp.]|nr:hypothetical protein [Catonella sp.]
MAMRQKITDVFLEVLRYVIAAAVFFAWWFAMFIIFSIFLMNIWHTNFDEILRLSEIMAVISEIIYIIYRVKKR